MAIFLLSSFPSSCHVHFTHYDILLLLLPLFLTSPLTSILFPSYMYCTDFTHRPLAGYYPPADGGTFPLHLTERTDCVICMHYPINSVTSIHQNSLFSPSLPLFYSSLSHEHMNKQSLCTVPNLLNPSCQPYLLFHRLWSTCYRKISFSTLHTLVDTS